MLKRKDREAYDLASSRCGLCLKHTELKTSHLMPKALYRKLRSGFVGNDLVLSQAHDKTSIYSDYQVTHKFLCSECESRFSDFGEKCVIPDAHAGSDTFPILDWVNAAKPFSGIDSEKWINPAKNNFQNTEAYLFFAASIVWRASAWPSPLHSNQGSLGSKYQEEFRKYLLGQQEFPINTYLAVYIDTDENITPLMLFPTSSKKVGYHHHLFYLPGMKFSLVIGNKVGGVEEIFRSTGSRLIFVSYSFSKHPDFGFFSKNLKSEYKPKGRLAKDRNC